MTQIFHRSQKLKKCTDFMFLYSPVSSSHPPPKKKKCYPPSPLHTHCLSLVTWKKLFLMVLFTFFLMQTASTQKLLSAKCFNTAAMEDSLGINLLPLHCKLSAQVSWLWLWAIAAQDTQTHTHKHTHTHTHTHMNTHTHTHTNTHKHTHTLNIQQQQLTQHRPTLFAGLWSSMLRNSTETNRGPWIRQKQQSWRQPDARNQ